HVAADLGHAVSIILDAGPSHVGVESTIVAATPRGLALLRAGGVPRERIEAVAGIWLETVDLAGPEAPTAPGQLASHYAPGAAVRLDAEAVQPGEALIAFGPTLPRNADAAVATINLSPRGDLIEAAARLFSALRELDGKAATIAVAPIPATG